MITNEQLRRYDKMTSGPGLAAALAEIVAELREEKKRNAHLNLVCDAREADLKEANKMIQELETRLQARTAPLGEEMIWN